jgi:hypothetical protein
MQRLALTTAAVFLAAACQSKTPEASKADSAAPAATGPAVGSTEWKIATYTSAAPPAISANATVLDWNDSLKAPGTELRKGTNGWTCMPLMAPPAGGYTTPVQTAAMCADAQVVLWAQGYMTKTKPKNTMIGIAYMLHGDMGSSNTDAYGMTRTADNDWVVSGPHIMIFPADPNRIKNVPTDHSKGEPYQMWKGTPYAHIMVPTPGLAMMH